MANWCVHNKMSRGRLEAEVEPTRKLSTEGTYTVILPLDTIKSTVLNSWPWGISFYNRPVGSLYLEAPAAAPTTSRYGPSSGRSVERQSSRRSTSNFPSTIRAACHARAEKG